MTEQRSLREWLEDGHERGRHYVASDVCMCSGCFTSQPHPGRFEGNYDPELAEVLWDLTLDGAHEAECGTAETTGWYALVWLGSHSYVIRQDSDGFVDIVWQAVSAENWNSLVAEVESELAEGD